ncbi:class C sortase [Leucobacter sp. NPDC077196]|uniref:class C sortase n=1 Tax=Leucobacter sp. NPDC077196 TaxID=3154959 RepID=UPI003421D020
MSITVQDRRARHAAPTPTPTPRRRIPPLTAAAALLALIGMLVFLYPSAAAWFSQLEQSRVISGVGSEVGDEPVGSLATEIARAQSYNDALVGGALLAEHQNVPEGTGVTAGAQSDAYDQLLRADAEGAMGRLRVPSIDLDLPIYHGTEDATLSRGVGHLEGTSLPVGGQSQHSVLTAHRGLATSELFNHLDQVRVGDTFAVEVFGEVLAYRVVESRVVRPDQTESLFPRHGADLMTLVTCTPLGINSHRILVTGERITPTPQADIDRAGERPDIPGFPWWGVAALCTVCVVGVTLVRAGRQRAGYAEGDPAIT